MKKTILTIVLLSSYLLMNAQYLTQSISGQVLDEITQSPLIGATIRILGSDPIIGTVADFEGYFRIQDVSIGRHNIEVTFIGYEPVFISNVLVTSGKSVQLNVQMKESQIRMEEIVIVANQDKDKPLNEMAVVSAKTFTVEETRRYAGGFDDPARLASAFAGVTTGTIDNNGIIIRGNAPKGVQWRIEGVEVPNPSHFQGADVAGGGFFTLLSSQTLSNSDFFTGAFPAEYGNALSGVFDINLRSGNRFEREHTFQAGVIGVDFASEGPFKADSKSTYLFNYRYSTFGLIQPLLPEGSSKINYQDLSFKLHFPTKAGTFELWGVGGHDKANTNNDPKPDSARWETDDDFETIKFGFDLASYGLTHKAMIGEKIFMKTVLSSSVNNSYYNEDVLRHGGEWYDENSIDQQFYNNIGTTQLNYKHSPSWNIRIGMIASSMKNYIKISSALERYSPLTVVSTDKDIYQRYQGYVQSQHYLNSSWILNVGLHSQYAEIVDEVTLEPRLGISWKYSAVSSFSLGYGHHSMLEDNKIYSVVDINGEFLNKDLGFTKAHHAVLGWDRSLNANTRIKVESYYQYLYDIPTIADSSFSMINFTQDWFFQGDLDPIGTGRNYGIDLTLERFMNNNFYYLATGSIFKSEYKDGLGDWHPTRFARNYSMNLLGGKEWPLNGGKNRLVGVNLRLNMMGGQRRSPIDKIASIEAQEPIYNEFKPFQSQQAPVQGLDLTVTWRKNKERSSSVWAFQIKNALGSQTDYGYSYNYKKDALERDLVSVVIPNISYKIEF